MLPRCALPVLVQAPETAQAPLMVKSALAKRLADWVLPLDKIASLLRAA